MSAIPAGSDSAGETNRVRCAYCGANNFPTSAACWQCGRPLQPLRAGAPAPFPSAPAGSAPPPTGWPPASAAAPRPFGGINPALAPKAAAALGFLFPWAGLPIGLAFLMLDDPRKAKLGWIAIGWSVAGTVLNGLLFLLPLLSLWPVLKSFTPHPPTGGGLPPGLPPIGGEEQFLSLHLFFRAFQQP